MLLDVVGRDKVERIAVLVSYDGETKFLGAPKLESSSGENIAIAVHKLLLDWNILDHVKGMAFDTTASNTGDRIGACLLLQQLFGLDLLGFPCRHHIYEIMLRGVFEVKLSKSSAPEVPLFERFAREWKNIDKKSFKSGLEDEVVRSNITDIQCDEVKIFCRHNLSKPHCRHEYKEFLQLVLLFLGDAVESEIRPPGPTSHARFMGKGIYDLKIFLFREQFHMSATQFRGVRDVCIFIIRIYIQVWYGCPNAISAPNQDLNFIKNSITYAQTDQAISQILLQKIGNHMWYLAEELVGLAFFDPTVSIAEKKKMAHCLKSTNAVVKVIGGRKVLNPENLLQYDLSDFVSIKTKNFFTRFGISTDFLKIDPENWELQESYLRGSIICHDLAVTNDIAERGVKFMKDFNRLLTNDEGEKNFLLHLVETYRKKYPSYKKSCLISMD